MNEAEIRGRLVEIEMALDHQSKQIEDLSDMVIRQGKIIDKLSQQTQVLKDILQQDIVKPLSEEKIREDGVLLGEEYRADGIYIKAVVDIILIEKNKEYLI